MLVRTRSSVKLARPYHKGRSYRFDGRVSAGFFPVPAGGVLIALQVRNRTGWLTARLARTTGYRGLAVTVLGDERVGLLAIAGYGTAQELAIAAIAVKRRRGRRVYQVTGADRWTTSVDDVARAAVRTREA